MKKLAPIILFVYNRPWHTQQTVEALLKNDLASQSELFIYADGAKQKNAPQVLEVRKYIKTIAGFKKITIIERDKNWGLADNIINGVTEIVNKYGEIIVMEDDIVASIGFLKYMNEALQMYKDKESVGCIHAWNYNLETRYKESTFFLKGADCWGWATWKRAWKHFNSNGEELLQMVEKKNLIFDFNRRNTHQFYEMLKYQILGKNNSWAIRWHASLFVLNKYCLQPTKAIVKNIGLDNSGTHCGDTNIIQQPIDNIKLKNIIIIESDWFFKTYKKQFLNLPNKKLQLFKLLKLFIPPIVLKIKNKLIRKEIKEKIKEEKYGWFGNYTSWDEAKKECTGYETDIILQKVKNTLLKVKTGVAVYERDSVIFDKKEYSENLLIGLLKAASENDYKLNVLDFGGSLGSTYYQNKDLLQHLKEFSWNIVEQENFVKEGKKTFENEVLKFYSNIDDCLKENKINVLILSSVLQYLENYEKYINNLLEYDFEYIIIDRTSFINKSKTRIAKQIVPEFIYKASYPIAFFSENKFLQQFKEKYTVEKDFFSFCDPQKYILDNTTHGYWKGFILKRNIVL